MSQVTTLANNMLKENYDQEFLGFNELKDYPTLMMMRKRMNTDLVGRYKFMPKTTAPGGNGSSTFSAAANGAAANQIGVIDAFELPPVAYYNYQQIPGATWAQARRAAEGGSAGAFMTMLDKATRDAITTLKQAISNQIWNLGYMVVGQVSAVTQTVVANDTIVLTFNGDTTNFYANQFIVVSPNNNGTSQRTLGTTIGTATGAPGLQITGVQPEQGNLIFAQSVLDASVGIPGLVAGDYIYLAGNCVPISGGVLPGLPGFEAWAPFGGVTNPQDSFYNVNRFGKPRLYGTSQAGTSNNSLLQTLRQGIMRARRLNHANPDVVVLSPDQYFRLENDFQAQNRYMEPGQIEIPHAASLEVGENTWIEGIKIGNGVTAVQDPSARSDRAVCFKQDELTYYCLNDGFEPWSEDGLTNLRGSGDTVDLRFNSYHNMSVNPQNVVTISLAQQQV